MFRVMIAITMLAACLGGCASMPPHRDKSAEPPPGCDAVFEAALQDLAARAKNTAAATPPAEPAPDRFESACWRSSHEHTSEYDLYFVEFDDQGWLRAPDGSTGDSRGKIKWITDQLEARSRQGTGSPLNLVVYTHGWHHSAAPEDGNVNAFRDLLYRMSRLEGRLGARARAGAASPRRKVVGLYIGWRGDSVLGPGLEQTSIWDRKLAAEEVAQGAVQELFARLHTFYLAHACHFSEADAVVVAGTKPAASQIPNCTGPDGVHDVHMLTIGHSFGALINYRALAGRLMSNIAEYPRGWPRASWPPYAHSFGDLVVLINPAFEGVHFEALARAAAERPYPSHLPDQGPHGAQLPTLIILQSEGDWATGSFFPLFRYFTSLFSATTSAEQAEASSRGVGWTDRYLTHALTMQKDLGACNLFCQLDNEQRMRETWRKTRYRAFGDTSMELANGLALIQCGLDDDDRLKCAGGRPAVAKPGSRHLPRPPYLPIWVVRTDPKIIRDHNDFLNPHLLIFVRQMYYTVLEESLQASPR
jgi:hypothetical protein